MKTIIPSQQRILCEEYHNKLIATITSEGILVWCMWQKKAELITKEQCMEVWARSEVGQSETSASVD